MSERTMLQPTAEHPITITPTEGRVVVRIGGEVVAETDDALTLAEASYPHVQYLPFAAVSPAVLTASDTTTYCPYKGDASYYHATVGGTRVEDVVWTYAQPYPAVAAIEGRVAFYADKADVSVVPAG